MANFAFYERMDYPLGVRWFRSVVEYDALIHTALMAVFVVIQTMLAVPLFHGLDRAAVKARLFPHHVLVLQELSFREVHGDTPFPGHIKTALPNS